MNRKKVIRIIKNQGSRIDINSLRFSLDFLKPIFFMMSPKQDSHHEIEGFRYTKK